jgi:hypothetical protein
VESNIETLGLVIGKKIRYSSGGKHFEGIVLDKCLIDGRWDQNQGMVIHVYLVRDAIGKIYKVSPIQITEIFMEDDE